MAMKKTAYWAAREEDLWRAGHRVMAKEQSWADVREQLFPEKTVTACRLMFDRLKAERGGHVPALIVGQAAPRTLPEELWSRAKQQTAEDLARHATERLASVIIPDDRPIGISFISDQHIRGSGPVDLERMEQDARLVAATPGLYACLGGDGVDNHIKHRAAMVGGGTKVADDWRRYDHYLGFFGPDKILGMISGNHDDWTRDEAGVDMVHVLAQGHRLHYAPDEMVLALTVGEQPYRVKFRHQYRYNSSFNQVHVVKRLWEMGDDPFDVGVVCHHHEAAIEQFTKHGQPVWGARPGSYQLTGTWARRIGFPLARPTCPTFLFWPDRREVLGFGDVRRAAEVLTYYRQAAVA